ncbi:hypothetical protein B0H14DRAFT_2616276 [Mycena olivaceomarginata]|nr:hypothetical protein B0H14DRAFT_2616276 [Mycena olivaceomarginata]
MTTDTHDPDAWTIALVGAPAVGKTRFISREDLESSPIEQGFSRKLTVDGQKTIVTLLDIYQGHRKIPQQPDDDDTAVQTLLRDADGYILMYSTTSPYAFQDVVAHTRAVRRAKAAPALDPVLTLVANQCDRPAQDQEVTRAEGKALARELDCAFAETSAKTGDGGGRRRRGPCARFTRAQAARREETELGALGLLYPPAMSIPIASEPMDRRMRYRFKPACAPREVYTRRNDDDAVEETLLLSDLTPSLKHVSATCARPAAQTATSSCTAPPRPTPSKTSAPTHQVTRAGDEAPVPSPRRSRATGDGVDAVVAELARTQAAARGKTELGSLGLLDPPAMSIPLCGERTESPSPSIYPRSDSLRTDGLSPKSAWDDADSKACTPCEVCKPLPHEKEAFWFQHRAFLEDAGYRLRPKFNPGFAGDSSTPDPSSLQLKRKHIMDAERIDDGEPVMLKWVSKRAHPHEVEVGCLFSAPGLVGSPRNHCVPILDVLQDPQDGDRQIIVMPRLIRFDEPVFDTVGEVVDCVRQIFERLHAPQHPAGPTALFPRGFHPVNYCLNPASDGLAYNAVTRTACWPRYYLIDFGRSRRYEPAGGPPRERDGGSGGLGGKEGKAGDGVQSLSRGHLRSGESAETALHPLGSVVHGALGGGAPHAPLQFLQPLADAMTHPDPAQRTTIGEAAVRFHRAAARLGEWQLRRPGQRLDSAYAWVGQVWRQVRGHLKGVPPLPAGARAAPGVEGPESPDAGVYTRTPPGPKGDSGAGGES